MIELYTGTPGSGKSLHLARDIFHFGNRKKDCLIIVNFPVLADMLRHPDRVLYVPNEQLSPALVQGKALDFFRERNLPMEENRIILLIDECQLLFNSRSWQDKSRAGWLAFFTQHRKLGVYCILVSQFDLMIDKQIRALIEYEVIHRKVTNYGFFGNILKFLTFGEFFVAVEKWYTINQKIGSYWFRDHVKYHSLYNTFDTFGEFPGLEDKSLDKGI